MLDTVQPANLRKSLFNDNGTIQTFSSVEDILETWYYTRLQKYEERKEDLIGKIENELDLLKYKAMFIKYVLEKKIIIFKQKRQDIINKLIELKFPELSTSKDNKSYDYITSIPLFNLTLEKIDELNDKLKEKEKELDYVKTTPSIEVWKQELKELLTKYNSWYSNKVKEFNDNISGNVKIINLNKKTSIKRKRNKKQNSNKIAKDI